VTHEFLDGGILARGWIIVEARGGVDYKVGLFYISPFDLFVEGEPVITRLEKKKSRSPSE